MEVIRLKQKSEVDQLDRLLNGLAKKRQSRQQRALVIAYSALAISTMAGFGLLNHKIEVALTNRYPAALQSAAKITPANLYLEELPDIEVVLL